MLLQLDSLPKGTYVSGWTAQPISREEAVRREKYPELKVNASSHWEAQSDDLIMVIRTPGFSNEVKWRRDSAQFWQEHNVDISPDVFRFAVEKSAATGILNLTSEAIQQWKIEARREQSGLRASIKPSSSHPSEPRL